MKLSNTLIFIAVCLGIIAGCAIAAHTETPKAVPVIPDAIRAEFFKAQVKAGEAQQALQQTPQYKASQEAQNALQGAISAINGICGKDFQPQMSPAGDPICVAKPLPKEEAKPLAKVPAKP
jgi:hypothetical protein